MPGWLQILGALGLALSLYVVLLTSRENAYLAPVVKLQQDRGQSAVSTGPYRYVRHPMYSGMLLFFPAITLLLGSWWGLLLSSALIGLFVLRTILEDRMLRNELAGYPEYARNVTQGDTGHKASPGKGPRNHADTSSGRFQTS